VKANCIVLQYKMEVARISTGQLPWLMVKGEAAKYNSCSTRCGTARVDGTTKGPKG